MLDFVLSDDVYVYNDPTIFVLEGIIFRPFMAFTYRGSESNYHCEDKPDDCDVFTYEFYHRNVQHHWVKAGWVDRYNDYLSTREHVKQHAISVEGHRIKEKE